jgi:hypothetical protein
MNLNKHEPGVHDQLTHGRRKHTAVINQMIEHPKLANQVMDAIGKSPVVTPPAPKPPAPKPLFDSEAWEKKSPANRIDSFYAQSASERDKMADAARSIPQVIQTRLKFAGKRPQPSATAIDDRLKKIGDFIHPDATKKIGTHVKALQKLLADSGVAEDVSHDLVMDALDSLVVQENESMSRQIGDHGARHVLGDLEMAYQVIDQIPNTKFSSKDRAALALATIHHDSGYLAPPSQIFLDKDHPRWSRQNYDANIRLNVERALGADVANKVGEMIVTHDGTQLDWKNDPLTSSLRLADNLALFHSEKLPALFKYVPDNIRVLKELGAGKINEKESQRQMLANIRKSDLSPRQKTALRKATKEVSAFTPKATLGMLGGKIDGIKWTNDHVTVNMKRNHQTTELNKLQDLGQRQFSKFAKAFGLNPDDLFKDSTEDLVQRSGDKVLTINILGELMKHVLGVLWPM